MRYCNICILIHDKKPDLEIIPTFLKKLENLEDNHFEYSRSFLETLVNNSKINEEFGRENPSG